VKFFDRLFGKHPKKRVVRRPKQQLMLPAVIPILQQDEQSLPLDEIQPVGKPTPPSPAISKIKPIAPVTMSYAQTYSGGRGMYSSPEYDLAEIGVIEDVDAYVAQAFQKKLGLMFKEGFSFVGSNKKNLQYYKDRMSQMAQASSIPTSELLRRIAASLIRTSNAFLVKVRKDEISGGEIRRNADGVELKPIAAYFPAAPETMKVDLDAQTGRINGWRQELPNGNKWKDFRKEDVVHFTINKREGFIFGTPTLTPVIDDIRALRQIEENIELLVHQHLFPLFHYTVGTETAPAGYAEDGRREIDIAKDEIRYMPAEGGIVTPERHTIEIVGAENKALRVETYVEHFKKRVIAGLGISAIDLGEGDCYDSKTETLTENGWKLHTEINHVQERIATYNPETNKIELVVPLYKYEGNYTGDMIRFTGKHIDIFVTPHHEMWVCPKDSLRKDRTPNWHKVFAADLWQEKYKNFYIRETAVFTETQKISSTFFLPAVKRKRGHKPKPVICELKDFAAFLGYFISEGCLDQYNGKLGAYRALISQNPGSKLEKMIQIVSRLGISFSIKNKQGRESTIRLNGKTLYKWLEQNVGCGAHNKTLPKEIFSWPKEIREILLDALILGDGTIGKVGHRTYYTVSKLLADNVQILALSLGLRAKVTKTKQSKNSWSSGSFIYRVAISTGGSQNGFRLVNQDMITKEYYQGGIYCYNVPNHLFVTRRNGKVTIQGNTSNRATANTLSRALIDSVKSIQDALEAQWDQQVGMELMFESMFGETALLEQEFPKLRFSEIDIDNRIAQDEHALALFKGYAITFQELRASLSRDPIIVPEDSEDQDPKKYPEWFSTYWKLIEEPALLIRAADEPYSLQAQALAKAKGSSATQGDIKVAGEERKKELETELEAEKETKIAVAKAKPRPSARKDSFLTQSYTELEGDTTQRILANFFTHKYEQEDHSTHFTMWGEFIKQKFVVLVQREVLNGFNVQTHNKAYLAAEVVQHGRQEVTKRVERFVDRFIVSLLFTMTRRVKQEVETSEGTQTKLLEALHSSFASHTYRLDFALDTEVRKAFSFGKVLGMRFNGVQELMYTTKEEACDVCKALDGSVVKIGDLTLDDVVPHHPGCVCNLIPKREE